MQKWGKRGAKVRLGPGFLGSEYEDWGDYPYQCGSYPVPAHHPIYGISSGIVTGCGMVCGISSMPQKTRLHYQKKINRPIPSKVDQLMALCNELEAGLVQAQTEGWKLMKAVVHQLSRD